MLTAAVVDRIVTLHASGKLPRLRELTLETWEIDKAFLPDLRRNLAACAEMLRNVGISVAVDIHGDSFIEGAVRALDPGLFGTSKNPEVSHAILNPPYCKIATRSRERILLASIGIETSNLYSAFVWLALRLLVDGGELSAITPRSFCNGPYFREFRRDMLDRAEFRRIHLFDSRTEAFCRDEVLQENILFHMIRGSHSKAPLTISTGSLESPAIARIPRERFVSPADPDRVMHIATESDANSIRGFFDALPCKLTDLGIEVSTGPVVDFRLRESLAESLVTRSVPLVYPHCVKGGRVLVPLTRSADYGDARVGKKPVAIHENEKTRRWLVPLARFVLIKRFSSKEEKRRLVAGVLDPSDFPDGLLGIENHLNFFHRKRAGLSAAMARGLSRFLNSTVADRYFRQFNGHTQVNASDLRLLRYPDAKTLERLGKMELDDTQQHAIDLAITSHLDAPPFMIGTATG